MKKVEHKNQEFFIREIHELFEAKTPKHILIINPEREEFIGESIRICHELKATFIKKCEEFKIRIEEIRSNVLCSAMKHHDLGKLLKKGCTDVDFGIYFHPCYCCSPEKLIQVVHSLEALLPKEKVLLSVEPVMHNIFQQ